MCWGGEGLVPSSYARKGEIWRMLLFWVPTRPRLVGGFLPKFQPPASGGLRDSWKGQRGGFGGARAANSYLSDSVVQAALHLPRAEDDR